MEEAYLWPHFGIFLHRFGLFMLIWQPLIAFILFLVKQQSLLFKAIQTYILAEIHEDLWGYNEVFGPAVLYIFGLG